MKVLVTGGTGLVGSAINEVRDKDDDVEWLFLSSKDCDLRDVNAVDNLFSREKPDVVIHLAAHVGGLFKNMREKATMYENNILSYVYIMVLHIHLTKDMHMQSVCWMFKVECIDNNLIKSLLLLFQQIFMESMIISI